MFAKKKAGSILTRKARNVFAFQLDLLLSWIGAYIYMY
jgi:hypothetical protein